CQRECSRAGRESRERSKAYVGRVLPHAPAFADAGEDLSTAICPCTSGSPRSSTHQGDVPGKLSRWCTFPARPARHGRRGGTPASVPSQECGSFWASKASLSTSPQATRTLALRWVGCCWSATLR